MWDLLGVGVVEMGPRYWGDAGWSFVVVAVWVRSSGKECRLVIAATGATNQGCDGCRRNRNCQLSRGDTRRLQAPFSWRGRKEDCACVDIDRKAEAVCASPQCPALTPGGHCGDGHTACHTPTVGRSTAEDDIL